MKEIGSEFWLNDIYFKENNCIPAWLEKFGNTVLTSSGRGAISLILDRIKPVKKTVLLPEYICESVISPFIEKGYICFFYKLNSDLSPNIDDINKKSDVGIFLHLGYYGYPTNSNLKRVLSNLREKSVTIIEDVTHTLFSRTIRFEENDFYIGSIRKWFGTPGGGFLADTKDSIINLEEPVDENKYLTELRTDALLNKGKYMSDKITPDKYIALEKFIKAENSLNNDMGAYRLDKLSKNIIGSIRIDKLLQKRVENFRVLSKELNSVEFIDPIFDDLKENVYPIFYPILIKKNKSELKKKLIAEKIYCPVHWPLPKQLKDKNIESTKNIYDNVLSIPCDQRYSLNDMKRIVSVIKAF